MKVTYVGVNILGAQKSMGMNIRVFILKINIFIINCKLQISSMNTFNL